ncbi:PadR family transcriptional regulator [Terriglobus roseus]|uniref:Transcriptional regulator, PadR family n=1 Tax=Terriglobus roseus TaxID=392734 RepID=A0A1G7LJ23_9BACT|nr:PadR family transcriptional regulator [Terriglobus roseus]SDF49532.1 transcriptional regulator, PadR family [Terriglobus roseus]
MAHAENETVTPLPAATLYVLLALASEDRHGYGIIQEVSRLSSATYRVGSGTLYDNLKKLLQQEWVEDYETQESGSGETRRMYRITDEGRRVLAADVTRMKRIVRVANRMLADEGGRA